MIRTQTTVGTRIHTRTRIRIRILSSYTVGTFHTHSDTDCCTRRSRSSHADTRGVPPCDERPRRSLE